MWDYTVRYQRKQSGDYLARVPALGWSVTAPTRGEAHQKVREAMPEWFTVVQQAGGKVEEDSEVLRLSGDAQGQLMVTAPKMGNPDQVNASEIGDFQFCQESWRMGASREEERVCPSCTGAAPGRGLRSSVLPRLPLLYGGGSGEHHNVPRSDVTP